MAIPSTRRSSSFLGPGNSALSTGTSRQDRVSRSWSSFIQLAHHIQTAPWLLKRTVTASRRSVEHICSYFYRFVRARTSAELIYVHSWMDFSADTVTKRWLVYEAATLSQLRHIKENEGEINHLIPHGYPLALKLVPPVHSQIKGKMCRIAP